jgi:hypothetical protein
MQNDPTIYALHISLSLVCFFILNYCWRTYRIDVYRQFLFDVRDELFDLAKNHFGLDDPIYRKLREQLNAAIRFAHKTTFLRMFFLSRIGTRFRSEFNEHRSRVFWDELIERTESPEVVERIRSMQSRVNQLTVDRIVSTALPPLYILLKLTVFFRVTSRISVDPIETQAMEIDAVEHRRLRSAAQA